MIDRIRDLVKAAYAELDSDRSELYIWRNAKSFVEAVTIALSVILKSQHATFNVKYVSGPEKEFEDYLVRWCNQYFRKPEEIKSSYTTITQSSGFGKSRLLFQLAKGFAVKPPSQSKLQQGSGELSFDIGLLYVNAPSNEDTTWIPRPTPELYNFFSGRLA